VTIWGCSVAEPFILAGSPELLRALAQAARADPELRLMSVSGPEQSPTRLVVEMTPERAQRLRAAYGSRLVIEPDEPLEPFA
jgi:hypothetical protein